MRLAMALGSEIADRSCRKSWLQHCTYKRVALRDCGNLPIQLPKQTNFEHEWLRMRADERDISEYRVLLTNT